MTGNHGKHNRQTQGKNSPTKFQPSSSSSSSSSSFHGHRNSSPWVSWPSAPSCRPLRSQREEPFDFQRHQTASDIIQLIPQIPYRWANNRLISSCYIKRSTRPTFPTLNVYCVMITFNLEWCDSWTANFRQQTAAFDGLCRLCDRPQKLITADTKEKKILVQQ